MALISCPECNRSISNKAHACIGCGFPVHKILTGNAGGQNRHSDEHALLPRKVVSRNVDVKCPHCQTVLTIEDSAVFGTVQNCPSCNSRIRIPVPQPVVDITPVSSEKMHGLSVVSNPPVAPTTNEVHVQRDSYSRSHEGRFEGKAFYTSGHVAWATLVGSCLGGALLMIVNYHRLGREKDVAKTAVIGIVGFLVLLFVVEVFAPSGIVVCIAQVAFMQHIADKSQKVDIENACREGGVKGSGWGATAMGFLGTVLMLVLMFFLAILAST